MKAFEELNESFDGIHFLDIRSKTKNYSGYNSLSINLPF